MTILFIIWGCVVIPGLILFLTAYRVGVLIERRKRLLQQKAMMQQALDNDRVRPVSRHFQQLAAKQRHND
jgi:hypothetical protein